MPADLARKYKKQKLNDFVVLAVLLTSGHPIKKKWKVL